MFFDNEKNKTQLLDHVNILKIIKVVDEGIYRKKNGQTYKVKYFAYEECGGGEIFAYLTKSGPLPEDISLNLFWQLLQGFIYNFYNDFLE